MTLLLHCQLCLPLYQPNHSSSDAGETPENATCQRECAISNKAKKSFASTDAEKPDSNTPVFNGTGSAGVTTLTDRTVKPHLPPIPSAIAKWEPRSSRTGETASTTWGQTIFQNWLKLSHLPDHLPDQWDVDCNPTLLFAKTADDARISSTPTSAIALQDTRERTARSTLMNVLRTLARTEGNALTKSTTTPALVQLAGLVLNAASTLMIAQRTLV
jgi:hypothetical protein